MKAAIHPDYQPITVTCSCGHRFETASTLCAPLHIEVCNACHPYYTGQHRAVNTGGRVERFMGQFGNIGNIEI